MEKPRKGEKTVGVYDRPKGNKALRVAVIVLIIAVVAGVILLLAS